MKSYIAGAFVILVALAGCNDNSDEGKTQVPVAPPSPAPAMQPAAAPAPAAQSGVAAASGPLAMHADGMPVIAHDEDLNCVGCHQIDSRLIGPPWREVANRYKGAATYKYNTNGSKDPNAKEMPLVDGLVQKVSMGGHGNWGTMPMPANDPSGKKRERIEKLVHFILSLAK